jgi:predicted RNA-binding Zn ribbon-like protein
MATEERSVEALCIDFLNSDWRDWNGSGRGRQNRLDNPEWLEAFLEKWQLEAPLPLEEPIRTQLMELRDRMRLMVEEVEKGKEIAAEELAELNRVMALAPSSPFLVVAEGAYVLRQRSSVSGWDLIMARIAASFADLLASHDLRRIKICANPDCQWIYYDQSRNRVRRWCDEKACGNLMKVRRFRERHKETGQNA